MDLQEMICDTFPLYEDMDDIEVAQTIWRRRGAEILGERLKQKLIDEVCEWVKENASYFAHWEWNGDTYEKEVVFDAECCIEAFKESMKGE